MKRGRSLLEEYRQLGAELHGDRHHAAVAGARFGVRITTDYDHLTDAVRVLSRRNPPRTEG
jgi:hypothetical protein